MEGAEKMNWFSMRQKELFVVGLAFVSVFVVTVLIGLGGPSVLREYTTTSLNEGVELKNNKTFFVWELSGLDLLNQQVFMRMQPLPVESAKDQTAWVLTSISVWCSDNGGRSFTPQVIGQLREREVVCKGGRSVCEPIILYHAPFVQCSNYRIAVAIPDDYLVPWIKDVQFVWHTISYNFTVFELWFRAVFLALTVIVSCIYGYSLRNIRFADWTYEQKWVAVLLLGLLLYNNPLASLIVLVKSWFFGFLDVCFFTTFFCLLLFFWLCMFDGIRKHHLERDYRWFYAPKLALCGGFWLMTIIVLAITEMATLSTSTSVQSVQDLPGYIVIRVFQLLILLAYMFWLMFVIIRSAAEKATSRYSTRLQFLGSLSAFVVLLTGIGLIVNTVSAVNSNAAQFLSFFSLYNLYVFVLALAFAPSAELRTLAALANSGDSQSRAKLEEIERCSREREAAEQAAIHAADLEARAPVARAPVASHTHAHAHVDAPAASSAAAAGVPMHSLNTDAAHHGADSDDSLVDHHASVRQARAAREQVSDDDGIIPISALHTVRIAPYAFSATSSNPSAPFPELL